MPDPVNSKLIAILASFLIAVLTISNMVPMAVGESVSTADTLNTPESAVSDEEVGTADVVYCAGLSSSSSAVGAVAGTMAARAMTEFIESILIDQAVMGGCEGAALASAVSSAHLLATLGGVTTGVVIGLGIAALIFFIGYQCY